MEKYQKFEREGKQYEISKDGTEYFPENKKCCIKPPDKDRKCIGIDSALKNNLIREIGVTIPDPLLSTSLNENPNLALFGSENIPDSSFRKSTISDSCEGSEPEESQTETTETDVDSTLEALKPYSDHGESSTDPNQMPTPNNTDQSDDQDIAV